MTEKGAGWTRKWGIWSGLCFCYQDPPYTTPFSLPFPPLPWATFHGPFPPLSWTMSSCHCKYFCPPPRVLHLRAPTPAFKKERKHKQHLPVSIVLKGKVQGWLQWLRLHTWPQEWSWPALFMLKSLAGRRLLGGGHSECHFCHSAAQDHVVPWTHHQVHH